MLHITIEEVFNAVLPLAKNLKTTTLPELRSIKYICPVVRGGLVPASLLSRLTNIPLILGCHASTRHTPGRGAQHHFKGAINAFVKNVVEETLFVDDFIDSGFTHSQLRRLGAKHITALFERNFKSKEVDIHPELSPPVNIASSEWLVFPWEILDTEK